MRLFFIGIIAGCLMAGAEERVCGGRVYAERNDDLAWENDLVAFRVYGPATQRRGERSYGYDIFLKYPDRGMVLERLYGAQTSAENWAKVDSLRRIDPEEARRFEQSFTYHIDHGLGMDCYAVGPTLGCGVAAVIEGDSICYPWCYERVEITENGPERFEAELTFAPVRIGGDSAVTEHRRISLARGERLNRCEVWYEGLTRPVTIGMGVPLRGEGERIVSPREGLLAVVDPTQGTDNGEIFTGIVSETPCTGSREIDGHVVLTVQLEPGERMAYRWGAAWSRSEIDTLEKWEEYLKALRADYLLRSKESRK